jgi:CRISPR-associated protein (TIGR02584 family)
VKSMERCVVVAPVGPNPAAIAELVWHLASAGTTVVALHLVLESERSRHYVDKELLGPGRALSELRGRFGDRVPVDAHLVEARTADGVLPAHERHPDVTSAMSEPLWTAARNAQREAGDDPVVFGLTGGRRRVSTAIQTAIYQLLGRPGDALVDVRVSLPVASGGTEFFFPDQAEQALIGTDKTTTFLARDVDIWVEPVDVPRLRPLLQETDLGTFSDAKAAAAAMVADASPPAVEVDLWQGVVRIDGRKVKMPLSQVVAYQLVLAARARGEEAVETVDVARFRTFALWRTGGVE